MPMPINVQYIFKAINEYGRQVLDDEGVSDDFTDDLEMFTITALKNGAVRVTVDLALDPNDPQRNKRADP